MNRFLLIVGFSCLLWGCSPSEDSGSEGAANSVPSQKSDQTPTSPIVDTTPLSPQEYSDLVKQADQAITNAKYDEAVRLLTRAINGRPREAEAYLKRAALFAEAKLFPNAIADMSVAVDLDPKNPRQLNTRGYFLLMTKQYGRAQQDFNDAIGLNLDYPQPYNNRGLVWLAQGDPGKAIKDFDNAIRVKPDYVDALNNRGFALMQLDRNEEAVESLSDALEVDPDYLNAITNRGRAHFKLGNYQASIDDFTHAIELRPEPLHYYAHRAEAYFASGQKELAKKDVDHVEWTQALTTLDLQIKQSPRNADLWTSRGKHLLERNRTAEAESSFAKALQLDPRHTPALIGRARLHASQQDWPAVVSDCTAAIEASGSFEAYTLRGDAYFESGDFEKAVTDYVQARRFDDRVVAAYRNRARQYRSQGKADLAAADEAYAQSLEHQLTHALQRDSQAPPEMVIEQASFETAESPDEKPTK